MHLHIKKGFLNYSIIERKTFAKRLINWYTESKRDLPWRKTKDPYPVWLSEIILQQTRVEQGLPYWERFMDAFPTVTAMAEASQEQILRLWQGLGYYSRARNLHAAARHIANDLNGVFPDTYATIIQLKGVGPYTAAAIASICFDEAKPVVDGNVYRFASRFFGIKNDISKSGTRKIFEEELQKEIPFEQPGDFNQAMMEYGATVCAPKPLCDVCVFRADCHAYANDLQKMLPVKSGKLKVKNRYFNYIVFSYENLLFLKKRGAKDVWEGLFDFFLIEQEANEEMVLKQVEKEFGLSSLSIKDISETYVHILSHQKIHARFYELNISQKDLNSIAQSGELKAYSVEEVLNLPKPKLIVNYLQRVGFK